MLTDEDRTALMQAAHRADVTGCACEPVWDVAAAIVARHVAAALDMAANDPTLRLSGHSGVSITRLRQRAEKVRAAINPKETR